MISRPTMINRRPEMIIRPDATRNETCTSILRVSRRRTRATTGTGPSALASFLLLAASVSAFVPQSCRRPTVPFGILRPVPPAHTPIFSTPPDVDGPLGSNGKRQKIKRALRRAAEKVGLKGGVGPEVKALLEAYEAAAEAAPRPDLIGRVLEDAAAGVAGAVSDGVASYREGSQGSRTDTEEVVAVAPVEVALEETVPSQENVATSAPLVVAVEKAVEDTVEETVEEAVEEAVNEIVEEAVEEANDVGPSTSVDFTDTGEGVYRAELEKLSYEDIDYQRLIEEAGEFMEAPFLGEDQCLVPGEAVVRIEEAPGNARRIFAGIDIRTDVDTIWKLLTDYENLQKCVPNLVTNEVMQLYDGEEGGDTADAASLPPADRARLATRRMRGSKLKQVGGAKVIGITFSARTTLEVREWPTGLPSYCMFDPLHHRVGGQMENASGRMRKASKGNKTPLERYVFPRPFAVNSLPTKDITMQSVEDDDGEFRMYQGVWRMQPLPGCTNGEGDPAMRLTYAVEVAPRPYLPVRLIENRIALDLCSNLRAIRDYIASEEFALERTA